MGRSIYQGKVAHAKDNDSLVLGNVFSHLGYVCLEHVIPIQVGHLCSWFEPYFALKRKEEIGLVSIPEASLTEQKMH